MSDTPAAQSSSYDRNNTQPARPDQTEIRYLTPDMCTIHLGIHGALCVTVSDERTYAGVYAAYAFPVAHSDRYISLLQSAEEGKDFEIGMIRDLTEFPADQADLVRQALDRRYFIHTISRIYEISWDHGLVVFDVETDKGRVKFSLRWKNDRAVDYGRRGKVLIDVDENRYVIPDLAELPPGERSDFDRVIYW